MLALKLFVQRILKSSAFGKFVYPCLQKIWRAYRIPQRRRLLRKHGPAVVARMHHLLSEHKVRYYCDGGTLLGFIREQGFLAHDDDIDISIVPGTATPKEVLEIFMDAGYGFIHGFDYEGRILEFSVMDSSGVSIDVYFWHEKSKADGMLHGYQPIFDPARDYPNERANTLVQYDFAAPTGIKTLSVAGFQASVPENAEAVLASEYGPNWKVPDAKFNTVDDRSHREMPGFAFRVDKERILRK